MQPQSHSSCVGSIRKYFNLDLLFCLLFSTQPQAASKIFSSKVFQSLPLTYGRSSPFFSFTPISSIQGLIVLFWLLLCCKRQWISISHLFLFVFCGRSMILEGSTVSLVTCLMLSSVTPYRVPYFDSSSLPAFSQLCYALVDAQRPELYALLQTAPLQALWQHNHR